MELSLANHGERTKSKTISTKNIDVGNNININTKKRKLDDNHEPQQRKKRKLNDGNANNNYVNKFQTSIHKIYKENKRLRELTIKQTERIQDLEDELAKYKFCKHNIHYR